MKKLIIELVILLTLMVGTGVSIVMDFQRAAESGSNLIWESVGLIIGLILGVLLFYGVDYLEKKRKQINKNYLHF